MTLPKFSPNRSLGLKLIVVCGLVLLMAIPAMFISYIAFERSGRADDVTREVSERYGGEQYVSGPMILAPYTSARADGSISETGFYAVFAQTGAASFEDMVTTIRKRSLFKVPTYEAQGSLKGHFGIVSELETGGAIDIAWQEAKIIVSLSDVRGLNKDVTLRLSGGEARKFQPANMDVQSHISAPTHSVEYAVDSGARHVVTRPEIRRNGWLRDHQGQTYLSAPIGDVLAKGEAFDVSVDLELSGASRLGLTPFAQSTEVSLSSDWADPGFSGGFPPRERNITDMGFSAQWSVPYLRRGIRAHGKAHTLMALTAPEKLMTVQFVSVDNPYQTVNRALKYSVLFIGLVFLAYFLFEVIVGVRVHPAQYILIGLAQSIFYLLLLAFAERIGFTAAFLVSAGATVAATAGYAGAVFGGREYVLRAGAVFGLVYGLLYSLMRMQDFALMIGALASFLAIALTMYLTRHLDWYGLTKLGHAEKGLPPQP